MVEPVYAERLVDLAALKGGCGGSYVDPYVKR